MAHADVRELCPSIVAPDSLDLVLTDPPYPRAFMECWRWLGDFAQAALKPGGTLAALSGQMWLGEVLAMLGREGLAYRWTVALNLPGASTRVFHRRLGSRWKPCLLFTKAGGEPPRWLGTDVATAPTLAAQADGFHHWGQSAGAMDALASLLVEPGMVACDPFAGGGELALAAALAGASVLASDIEAEHVATMRASIVNVAESETTRRRQGALL
ncbi:MAG: hypothetical protein F4Y01_16640 [Gammaproteobacteria bacterium]|nr:hypothetical protein [Gammaproteobacteria bacterium]